MPDELVIALTHCPVSPFLCAWKVLHLLGKGCSCVMQPPLHGMDVSHHLHSGVGLNFS